jgi:N-methylhydantoinase A
MAVDVGGTFTDAVLVHDGAGIVGIDKVLTTPRDPSEGFLHAVDRLSSRMGVEPAALLAILHGTTIATNALLERRGTEAALLVTEGFRDILEIARQVRHELYNLQTEKPAPLIPRQRCLEIPERVRWSGEVLVPLDERAVSAAAEQLRELGVESVAICFLHAYRNPAHERRAAEIVRDTWPGASISLSSDVAPEIREYWRASTTVTNAYIRPTVQRYLERVEEALNRKGFAGTLHIMQSSGGMMSAGTARLRPIHMLESGPAAGVAAAAFIVRIAGRSSRPAGREDRREATPSQGAAHEAGDLRDAISFDMGGTTAKVGLIRGGQPSIRTEFEAGAATGTGAGLQKGSGFPILAPVMDLVEVGAGGGSLAWIDAGHLLRVGPRSTGADPGPACYGRGGTSPTVTDANLVLGRLDPDRFLGGRLRLDVDAATRAIEQACARPLGLNVVEAAMGIVDIANAAMYQAMRLISVQRGYDPREFALVAFGGAGPVHANLLAQELGIPRVLVPPSPGVASALGMLSTNVRHDYRITRLQRLEDTRRDDLDRMFRELEDRAMASLREEGFPPDQIHLHRSLDLRYVGQSWKLNVTCEGDGALDPLHLKRVFDQLHEQQYGYAVDDEPVEVVNLALSAEGIIPRLHLRELAGDGASGAEGTDASHGCARHPTAQTVRPVYFRETGGFTDTPVYDRYQVVAGATIPGPAIVAEMDATTVIHPGYRAHVDRFGILSIEPGAGVT